MIDDEKTVDLKGDHFILWTLSQRYESSIAEFRLFYRQIEPFNSTLLLKVEGPEIHESQTYGHKTTHAVKQEEFPYLWTGVIVKGTGSLKTGTSFIHKYFLNSFIIHII